MKRLIKAFLVFLILFSVLPYGIREAAAYEKTSDIQAPVPVVTSVNPNAAERVSGSFHINVSFTRLEGNWKYVIYRREIGDSWNKIAVIRNTSELDYCNDYDVVSGTKYQYAIKAKNADTGYTTDLGKAATIYHLNPVRLPGSIHTENLYKKIKVYWTAPGGATKYEVFRSENGGAYRRLATVKTTQYVDPNVKAGVKYEYRIRSGRGEWWSDYSTGRYIAYVPVTSQTLESPEEGVLQVTLKKLDVSGYKIQYTADPNFATGIKTIYLRSPDETVKTIDGLVSGKTYYVRAKAYKEVQIFDDGNTITCESAWKSPKAITIQ